VCGINRGREGEVARGDAPPSVPFLDRSYKYDRQRLFSHLIGSVSSATGGAG
jgi:hypothetical protein